MERRRKGGKGRTIAVIKTAGTHNDTSALLN